jgi:hypothetical protein
MLVRELIGVNYENRMKYLQGRKGQAWRIDEKASVQRAKSTSRKNLCMTV